MTQDFFSMFKISQKKEVIFLCLFAVLLFCIFFYKIEFTALASFDEAWYGTIARNLVLTKNPFLLSFNGNIFSDHPPLGFLMMAIPTFLFGSSESSVRLTSIICGVANLLLIYLLGKRFGSRAVGVAAALVVFSSLWFVFRVRSGNLDIPFLFWEIFTVYLATHPNQKVRYYSLLSFAALFLTKTLVGLGVIPMLVYSFWEMRRTLDIKRLRVFFVLALCMILPWYVINQVYDPGFLVHHFFEVGARGSKNSFGAMALISSMRYLAIGMGVWFKVFIVAVIFGCVLFFKNAAQRHHITLLALWFLGFSVFFLSSKTEIWHLLPVYPVVALLLSLFFIKGGESLIKNAKYIVAGKVLMLIIFSVLAVLQWKSIFPQLYKGSPEYSAEKDISVKSGKYQPTYIYETFFPAAAYYSQKNIPSLAWKAQPYEELLTLLRAKNIVHIIINADTKKRLEVEGVQFSVLERNSHYYLIKK